MKCGVNLFLWLRYGQAHQTCLGLYLFQTLLTIGLQLSLEKFDGFGGRELFLGSCFRTAVQLSVCALLLFSVTCWILGF